MIDGPLKADGRLAAKNATKIRAALTQVTNFKTTFQRYQETQPQATDNKTQDRARARAWLMLNVGFNNDALHNAIMHCWAEAYVLGQDAAGEWIRKAEKAQKALQEGYVDWDNWRPGDRATALLVKPVGGFQRYLEQSGGASYFKKFDKETIEMLGTSLADAIEAGLDSEAAALLMKNHVGSPGRALTIAITEQNRAMSFSTIQRYKQAELQKMEWHVSDPCPKCAQNSGQVIEIGGTFNSGNQQPPAHPHCRCVLLPVIPGMEEPIPGATTTTLPSGMAHTGSAPQVAPVMQVPQPRAAGTHTPGNWTKLTSEEIAERELARLTKRYPTTPNLVKDFFQRDTATQQLINNGTVLVNGPLELRVYGKGMEVPQENLQEILNHLDGLQVSNPKSEEVFLTIGASKEGAYGWAVVDGKDIWLAPKTAKMDRPNLDEGGAWKMPVLRTTKQYLYTLTHEWGHHIDVRGQAAITRKITALKKKYPDSFRSGYSRKDRYEFYAEMFAEFYLTGGKTENELVQAMAETFGWKA